jgi:hypothetical protein
VACGDAVMASCAVDYPDAPVCDVGGECVECTGEDVSACPVEAPACVGNVCVPCSEHAQCPDSACNMATGACMPTDSVWWVDQGASPGGDGSEENPFQSIGEALAQVGDSGEGTVHVQGPGPYVEQIDVFVGQAVAVLGVGGAVVQFFNAPVIDINSDANLFVSGLVLTGGEALVRCNSAGFWSHDSMISNGQKQGVLSAGCNVNLNRSVVARNDLSGVEATGGAVSIRSSVIGRNGDSLDPSTRGIKLAGASLDASFMTLARNQAMGVPAGIECTVGSMVVVRNSVVLSGLGGDAVMCEQIVIEQSATDDANYQGGTNVPVGAFDAAWFADEASGDFHLGLMPASGPFVDVAICDPTVDAIRDLDDVERPCDGMLSSYAGADEP